jgi:hypothetical protein
MKYTLVKDKSQIFLGPIDWRSRFIQSEIDTLLEEGDLSQPHTVPPIEQGYIQLTDGFEIYPITSIIDPVDFDPKFDDLIGPVWSFQNNEAGMSYTKRDRPIDAVKSSLKEIVAAERFIKENAGTMINIQSNDIFLDTSREGRNVFVQKYFMMGDGDTVNWKFPTCWLTLSKTELGQLVTVGIKYIQDQFDWEKSLVEQIDSAQTVDELRSIKIG